MSVKYELKGEKGNRKVVKTIDITEEAYNSFCKIMSDVRNASELSHLPLDDALNVFGGNCYGMIANISILSHLASVVQDMEDKGFLSVKGEDAFNRIKEAIYPSMCEKYNEEGTAYEELRFFSEDLNDVISEASQCLIPNIQQMFENNLREAATKRDVAVGEAAFGILMYISSEIPSVDKNVN